MPGSNATTVIPFGTSFANDLLNPSTAHFEVLYAETYKIQSFQYNTKDFSGGCLQN